MSEYRVVVTGPGGEVLDSLSLDGVDLDNQAEVRDVGVLVAEGVGGYHRRLCAALPRVEEL